jgi:putative transposase
MPPEKVKNCLSRMSGKLSRTVLRRGKGSNPFSLVDFTSLAFTDYCQSQGIKQSMSKAGSPYDNAPMERFYNTLKEELIYRYHFHTDEELNRAISEYVYIWYNQIRPHSYNNYKTPQEARKSG